MNETNQKKQVKEKRLRVAKSRREDVGKGTARLNRSNMYDLGIDPGDPISVEGPDRTTAAIALPLHSSDEETGIIRLDGLQRNNAGAGIRDRVTVRPADAKEAESVKLAPVRKNIRLQGSGEALKNALEQRAVVTGDVLSTSVYRHSDGGDGSNVPEDLFRQMLQRRTFGLQELRLVVASTVPEGDIVQITAQTDVELLPEHTEPQDAIAPDVTYDDVGGMDDVIDQVSEMIELPLEHPELFQRLGIDAPKGIILHGPPGCGKTLLARAVASETDASFFHIGGPEIIGGKMGEAEKQLRQMFQQAEEESPSIIFIDEIDSIAPKRDQASTEFDRRITAQLLTLMDGLEPRQDVVVIGATNRMDAIEGALRRPGRFDREIAIGVPDDEDRLEILDIHTRGMPLGDGVDFDELAESTYGFVGADIASLCREAAIDALRRKLPDLDLDGERLPSDELQEINVRREDFNSALKRVQPSALREIMVEVPDVRWEDVGGQSEAKTELQDGIELPLKNPDAFSEVGIRPARGFLLFGPPGCGKTLLAKAVAREAKSNFISAKSSDLLSKWYGESEQQISRLFQRARQVSPTVIFLDELDALAPERGGQLGEPRATERVVNTLLSEMDGLEEQKGVAVIGASNQPDLIDPALLRPGRFDELIYVPVPDEEGRRRILEIHSENMPLEEDVILEPLAEQTERFSGADLENLCRRAGLLAIRDEREEKSVTMDHFQQALEKIQPSVTDEMQEEYQEVARKLREEHVQSREKIGFQTGGSS